MSERHRLTITVTMALYEELCRRAGPRGISHWMEDAAWRKLQSRGHGEPQPVPVPGPTADGSPARPGLPPPPWCWSPLRPTGTEHGGTDR